MRGAAARAAFLPAPEGDAGPGAPNGTLFAPRLQKLGLSSPHARVLQLLAPTVVQGTKPQMLRPPKVTPRCWQKPSVLLHLREKAFGK